MESSFIVGWTGNSLVSCAVLFAVLVFIWVRARQKKLLFIKTIYLWIAGVFLSALILLIPLYTRELGTQENAGIRALISSFHQALQMFTLDVDRDIIAKLNVADDLWSHTAYWILSAELIIAPVLTLAFAISLFENISGILRYRISFTRDAYVFSELNEQSLALAKSVKQSDRRCVIMFTDVSRDNKHKDEAKTINAIIQQDDIQTVRLGTHGSGRKLNLFAIAEKEADNHTQALKLIDKYAGRENTRLYVFSARIECELLLNQKDAGKIVIRRINTVQSLIYSHLYNHGYSLLKAADETAGGSLPQACRAGKLTKVHCLLIGMGQHGTEMLKALSWFGQMPGYEMVIDAYDIDTHAEEHFAAICPELMSHNRNRPDLCYDDASYSINIHDGVDVRTPEFENELRSMKDVCYVLVALGQDDANILTAVKLRTLFASESGRGGKLPIIETIVYQTGEARALQTAAKGNGRGTGMADYSGTPYHIHFIGSIDDLYSVDSVIHPDLEKEIEKYHSHWETTVAAVARSKMKLHKYAYYYRSSYSALVHVHTLVQVLADRGIMPYNLDERKEELNMLEHCRWNAYMRSEGYRYAEKTNRLGKQHQDLVPFSRLDEKEKDKDDYLELIRPRLTDRLAGRGS